MERITNILDSINEISERQRMQENAIRHLQDLEFLSRSAMRFVELMPEDNIFRPITEQMQELMIGSLVLAGEYVANQGSLVIRAVSGRKGAQRKLMRITECDLVGMVFDITDDIYDEMLQGDIIKVTDGIQQLISNMWPVEICRRIEEAVEIGDIYIIPFVLSGELLGAAVILTKTGCPSPNLQLLEVYINQSAVALQRKRAEDRLAQARKDAEEAYEREHRIADALQRALIPAVAMELGNIGIAGTYRPALKEAEVGGDFYDVFELPDGRFALVMGDVSGKGLQAAVHTATAKYMLRAYAHQNPNPDYVMSNLNEAMCAYTPESLFVTVFYGVLDPQNKTMTYSNAGHDEPLFYVRSLGCALPLDITGRAIGVVSGSMYGQRLLKFDQGDIVMIYTDGITDARSEGKFFGIDGLSRVLTANIDRDEQTIANVALNAAEELAGGSLRDDAAVLVVKTRIGTENVDKDR